MASKSHLFITLWMSLCFSVVESAMIIVLGLATSINKDLGAYSAGVLYVVFAAAAVPAPMIVRQLGAKWGLVLGLGSYCLYVIANIFPSWESLIPAAALSGFGGAILWTSEGTYLTSHAIAEAESKGKPHDYVLGTFNGYFVFMFQAFLVVAQVVVSMILRGGSDDEESAPEDTKLIMYTVLSSAAVVATVSACFLPPLPKIEQSPREHTEDSFTTKFMAAIRLAGTKKMAFLIPSNVTYGLMVGFTGAKFSNEIVKGSIGVGNVSLIQAINAGAAALCGMGLGRLSDRYGRSPVMVIGFVANTVVCFLYAMYTPPHGEWDTTIIAAILMGVHVGVWNGTNSTIMGDYFSDDQPPAFANLKMWSGGASAVYFFIAPHMSRELLLWILIGFSFLGIAGYFLANQANKKERKQQYVPLLDGANS